MQLLSALGPESLVDLNYLVHWYIKSFQLSSFIVRYSPTLDAPEHASLKMSLREAFLNIRSQILDKTNKNQSRNSLKITKEVTVYRS